MRNVRLKVIAVGLAVAFYPSEAWMSGNAGFLFIEPDFTYEYTENFRKVVRTDEHETYWKAKRAQMDQMLTRSLPGLSALVATLKAEAFPLVPLVLTRQDPALPRAPLVEAQVPGENGDSKLRFQMSSPLSEDRKTRFNQLCASALLPPSPVGTTTGAAPGETDRLVDGLTESIDYPKFSLALSMVGRMKTKTAEQFRSRLKDYLKRLGPSASEGFDSQVSTGKMWIDPGKLISLKTKAASTGMPKTSVFNPSGPLHDFFGRRTSATNGLIVATMLFMTLDAGEDEDTAFSRNTAEFEKWFSKIVGEKLQNTR